MDDTVQIVSGWCNEQFRQGARKLRADTRANALAAKLYFSSRLLSETGNHRSFARPPPAPVEEVAGRGPEGVEKIERLDLGSVGRGPRRQPYRPARAFDAGNCVSFRMAASVSGMNHPAPRSEIRATTTRRCGTII